MAERLFTFQYSQEGKRSTEWVERLPEVVSALNGEMTKLTRKESVDAIKEKVVDAKSSTTYSRPVGMKKKRLDSSKSVDISVLLVSWKVVKENEQIQSGL